MEERGSSGPTGEQIAPELTQGMNEAGRTIVNRSYAIHVPRSSLIVKFPTWNRRPQPLHRIVRVIQSLGQVVPSAESTGHPGRQPTAVGKGRIDPGYRPGSSSHSVPSSPCDSKDGNRRYAPCGSAADSTSRALAAP